MCLSVLLGAQVLPTAGNRSVSVWDVDSIESFQHWLDETMEADCASEVFEVRCQPKPGRLHHVLARPCSHTLGFGPTYSHISARRPLLPGRACATSAVLQVHENFAYGLPTALAAARAAEKVRPSSPTLGEKHAAEGPSLSEFLGLRSTSRMCSSTHGSFDHAAVSRQCVRSNVACTVVSLSRAW